MLIFCKTRGREIIKYIKFHMRLQHLQRIALLFFQLLSFKLYTLTRRY